MAGPDIIAAITFLIPLTINECDPLTQAQTPQSEQDQSFLVHNLRLH